ncbi:MAG: DUF6442 family protein [Acetanaerobacterium sp.]
MKNRILLFSLLLAAGLALVIVGGFVFTGEALKNLSGVCIGAGAGLFGVSAGQIISLLITQRNPEMMKRQQVEENDERNALIRDKAKGKGFDAMSVIFGIAMLTCVLLDADIAVILVMVAAYLGAHGVSFYYLVRYSKEM